MMEIFHLENHDYIELHVLLKAAGFCESGGIAKARIAEGHVRVDGIVELRKRRKVRRAQSVEFDGHTVRVE